MKKNLLIASLILVGILVYFVFSGNARNFAVETKNDLLAKNSENVPVVIIPHFDAFAVQRSELLKNIGGKINPKVAIVVSVNHFNSGNANIITAEKTWTLSGGDVTADSSLVEKISESGIAVADEGAFLHEHGITNVLPDVRDNIAKEILPIIIKDTTSKEDIDDLTDWLTKNVPDSVLVASVDFSHYQQSSVAQVHDNYSIQALSGLDFEKIWLAETDSPQALYLSAKMAKNYQAEDFHLVYNSDSGKLNNSDDSETTSVVLGYYSDQPVDESDMTVEFSTSFVIAGDAMFDRNVWHNYKDKGLKEIFDNFGTRVFRGVDLSLLNLEGPISGTEINDDWQSGSLVFNFPPETTSVLKYLNINSVSLANNHSANAGSLGLANTKKVLSDVGIKYFGKPDDYDENSVLRIDGEIPLSIIGIMTLDSFDNSALEAKIKAEKVAGRFVMVYPHWGTEYAPKHSASQKQLSKSWISAGADLIIGSHPHVTEDFEIVDGKPVIYSLGNFVFDQFFSDVTQQGLVVAGTITKDKITLSFLPTVEKAVKPQFMTGVDKTAKIKTILDIDSQVGFKKISTDTIEISR